MARVLAFHHCGLGSINGSCSEGFSLGPLVFLFPQKPTFQMPIQPGNSGQEEPRSGMFAAKSHYYSYPIVYLNPLHPNISKVILHTVLHTFI